jgi:hypothetical protein
VFVEIRSLGGDLLGMGRQPVSARRGFLRFHVMAPFGDDISEASAIVDTLSGLFAVVAQAGGVTWLQTFAPTPPESGAEDDDGLWFVLSFSVNYSYWAGAAA